VTEEQGPPSKVSELSEEQLELLRWSMLKCIELWNDELPEPSEDEDTPELCDQLVRWWHSAPPAKRTDHGEIIWAIGAMAGEFLRHRVKVSWKMVEDEYGSSVCLVSDDPDNWFVLSPIESIAKRFDDMKEGFVADYLEGMEEMDMVASSLRGEDDPDPEPLLPYESLDEDDFEDDFEDETDEDDDQESSPPGNTRKR